MKRFSIAALIGILSLALIMPATVAASHQSGLLTDVPVTGTLEDGGTFEGLLSITGVSLNAARQLVFEGVLNGTATSAGGTVTQIVDQAFEVVANLAGPAQARCDILFLDLGPIFLDVLGLEVDLSQIILDIDAVPGPGNLLGNLLCAVVGLLDGGPLAGLTALLRNINRILG